MTYQKYQDLSIKLDREEIITYLLQDELRLVAMLTHVPSIVERNHGLGYSIQCNDYGPFD